MSKPLDLEGIEKNLNFYREKDALGHAINLIAECRALRAALAEKEEEAAWLRDANNLHLDQLHMKDAALTAQGERLAKAEAALEAVEWCEPKAKDAKEGA